MGGVYCPSCEAAVEPTISFVFHGNDLTVRGLCDWSRFEPIKDVIRSREDLSMAEKFDMIAKIEERQIRFFRNRSTCR